MITLCIEEQDPVLAMVMCAQHNIGEPCFATRINTRPPHVHVRIPEEYEGEAMNWLARPGSKLLQCFAGDGSELTP